MAQSTYLVRKPLKIGHGMRQPGQLAPEAASWFRVDHLVHSGFLVPVAVSDEEFDAAVLELCPEAAPSLYPKEHPMQDLAAQRALEHQQRVASDPRGTLTKTLAAPPNNLDASRSDVEAASAQRAAALTAEAEKVVAKEQKERAERREKGVGEAPKLDDVETKGAHAEFVSEQIPEDERKRLEHADDEPAESDAERTKREEKQAKEAQSQDSTSAQRESRPAQTSKAAVAKKTAEKKS